MPGPWPSPTLLGSWRNSAENTTLHWAAFKAKLGITRVLLNHGANTNAKNKNGEMPFHWVLKGKYCYRDDIDIIAQLLLERGMDVNAKKKDKGTPLHFAAFMGKLEMAQVLLSPCFFSHIFISCDQGVSRPWCRHECKERAGQNTVTCSVVRRSRQYRYCTTTAQVWYGCPCPR